MVSSSVSGCNQYIIILGALGNAPKMLWTTCPQDKDSCDRCLDVTFEIGKDTACLKQKWSDKPCVFEGTFLASGTRVAVSSEECLMVGYLDNIQVLFYWPALLHKIKPSKLPY